MGACVSVLECECAVYQANKSAVMLYAKQLKEWESGRQREREKNRQPVVNYRTQYNTAKAAGAEASQLLQHWPRELCVCVCVAL